MTAKLTAVTIGIGALHEALAREAAQRMRMMANVPTQILGLDDLARSGVRHPCHLKFRVFDLVDAENILFFDADAFCLRPWDPTTLCDQRELVAVRGWYFDPWVTKFGPVYGFHDEILNGGLFLCNRTHHAGLLRLSESLQPDNDRFHDLPNPDEVSISAARAILGTPIRFLDRRYNWIEFGRGTLAAHADVVIAHACSDSLRRKYKGRVQFLRLVSAASKNGQIDPDLGGKTFIYDRLGYDRRPLTFREDGTIGAGVGGAERYFFTTGHHQGKRLVIGSQCDETCILRQDIDGVWRGRWSKYERMPVTLTKHRAQVVIDLLKNRSSCGSKMTGVEIGVFRGETSALLLRELPTLTLFMVDPWREASADSDYWSTNAGDATMNQAMFDQAMLAATSATEFAAARRRLVPCRAHRAATALPNDLDFVFVDGDHSQGGAAQDIQAWWPKLSTTGLMCGHDYGNPNFPGVKHAVDSFANAHGLTVRCDHDMVWYFDNSPDPCAQQNRGHKESLCQSDIDQSHDPTTLSFQSPVSDSCSRGGCEL